MFRVSPLMIRSTHILIRRNPTMQVQVTSITRVPALHKSYKRFEEPERPPCPPKIPVPPCPPAPKNRNFLWTTLAVLILIGVATVKAKDSKEFRDWLTMFAPYFDEYVSALLQENKPLAESLKEFTEYCKRTFQDLTRPYPEECNQDEKPPQAISAPPPSQPTPPAVDEGAKPEGKGEEKAEGGDKAKTEGAIEAVADTVLFGPAEEEDPDDEPLCALTPPDQVTKDVCQIEACIKDLGDDVYHNYLTGKDACIYYNKLVNESMKDFSFDVLDELKRERKIRLELVGKSIKNVNRRKKQLYDLMEYVKCACDAPPARLEITRKLVKEYEDKIERVRIDFEKQNQRALQRDLQWKIVAAKVDIFCKRMTSMYPEIDFHAKKPGIKGDIDFYLLLMEKYLGVLKSEVMASSEIMVKRAHRAVLQMDAQKPPPPPQDPKAKKGGKKDETPTTESKSNEAYSKAVADMNKEFEERDKSIKQKHEKELKDALDAQKNEFDRTFEEKWAEQEQGVKNRFEAAVAEKVGAQKKIFDDELDAVRKQLRGVEDSLAAKKKAEKESQRAQNLYTAGMALLAATRRGEPRVCVRRTLEAIKNAAVSEEGDEPDPLVMTLLKGIPDDVWENGLVPESVLRYRYNTMEDVAQKVSMVEAEGGPLLVYGWSWLQATLLGLIKCSGMPQVEIDNPPDTLEGLDTFDLLQRARYFMERGNIAMAMRYVEALEGASRGAAEAWRRAARAHLQARQAAEALVAHAAALALQYL